MGNTNNKPSTQDLPTFIKKEIKTWEAILIYVKEKRKNAYVENYIYDAFDATEERWSRIKIDKYRIPKESPTRQNSKCCRLGLIEPVHGRYWKVQVTVHAP
jgi:hypothetical protein